MEKPNLNKENVTGSEVNTAFFSKENIKKFLGEEAAVLGTLLTLAGIAEFATGEKLVSEAANWAINNLDSLPVVLKTSAGASLMLFANSLLGSKKEKHG